MTDAAPAAAQPAHADAPEPRSSSAPRPAHRDGNVLRWLAAYTSSALGDNIYYIALSWAAVQAGTPGQAGLVLAVSALPRALLMLGGGVVADRFGPRRVVIGSDAVRCAAVFTVAVLLFTTGPGLWPLAVLGLLFGTVDAVFMPAVGALPTRITGRDQLARVQGMRGVAIRTANAVGVPLGGLGVALGGPAAAFAAAGLLFAVSLPLLTGVRFGSAPAARPRTDAEGAARSAAAVHELRDGLRYMAGHRVLAPLFVVAALSNLGFVGPLNIGLVLLADARGWGAAGVGWVLAGFGVGAGATSLLLTVRGRLPRAGLVLSLGAIAGALAIAALAFVAQLTAAIAVALVIGLLTGLSGALSGALAQTAAEPAYIGRVTAASTLFSLGITPLTFPLTGMAVGLWGTAPVFVASAAVCAAGGAFGLCSRQLRRAELPG